MKKCVLFLSSVIFAIHSYSSHVYAQDDWPIFTNLTIDEFNRKDLKLIYNFVVQPGMIPLQEPKKDGYILGANYLNALFTNGIFQNDFFDGYFFIPQECIWWSSMGSIDNDTTITLIPDCDGYVAGYQNKKTIKDFYLYSIFVNGEKSGELFIGFSPTITISCGGQYEDIFSKINIKTHNVGVHPSVICELIVKTKFPNKDVFAASIINQEIIYKFTEEERLEFLVLSPRAAQRKKQTINYIEWDISFKEAPVAKKKRSLKSVSSSFLL
jgi:hypothetical protein